MCNEAYAVAAAPAPETMILAPIKQKKKQINNKYIQKTNINFNANHLKTTPFQPPRLPCVTAASNFASGAARAVLAGNDTKASLALGAMPILDATTAPVCQNDRFRVFNDRFRVFNDRFCVLKK